MKLVIRYNEITNSERVTAHVNDWRPGGIFINHNDKSRFMTLIQDTAAKPNTEFFGHQH
jgi:hypothetical protein